jgi:hypothetical protein
MTIIPSASYMTKQSQKWSVLQRGIIGSSQMNNTQKLGGVFLPIRNFSLPDHIKLEMPNLSPTMEKVSTKIDYL